MSKSKVKSLLIIGIVLVLVLCIEKIALAENTEVSILGPDETIGENNEANNVINNIVNNTSNNNTPTLTTKNYTLNNTNTSSLPKTGESDIYIVTILIFICGVVSIYAYKKIRDYKNL